MAASRRKVETSRYPRSESLTSARTFSQSSVLLIAVGGTHPDRKFTENCVIEDCIVEQPCMKHNTYTTTCIIIAGGERPTDGDMAFHRGCAIRRCFVNGDRLENPVEIESITFSLQVGTATTRKRHGRNDGDWVVITGAMENGMPSTIYNGSFKITKVDDRTFTFTLRDTPASPASGEIFIGVIPGAKMVQTISHIALGSATTGGRIYTVTSAIPHNRVPGDSIHLAGASDSDGPIPELSGSFLLAENDILTNLQVRIVANTDRQPSSLGVSGFTIQALSADGGTGAVVEQNFVTNVGFGFYHDAYATRDLTIRHNHFRNVLTGIYHLLSGISPTSSLIKLKNIGEERLQLVYPLTDPPKARAKTLKPHGLLEGDKVVLLNLNPPSGGNAAYYTDSMSRLPFVENVTEQSFEYALEATPDDDIVPVTPPHAHVPGYATEDRRRLLASLSLEVVGDKSIVTAQIADSESTYGVAFADHGLLAGDAVFINRSTPNPYNGFFQVSEVVNETTFKFEIPSSVATNTLPGYYGRQWQVARQVIESNIAELAPSEDFALYGINLSGADIPKPYVFRQSLLRRNVVRRAFLTSIPSEPSLGIALNSCGSVLAELNVLDLQHPQTISFTTSGIVRCFQNLRPSGHLIRGVDALPPNTQTQEIRDVIHDAITLTLLR